VARSVKATTSIFLLTMADMLQSVMTYLQNNHMIHDLVRGH